MLKRQVLREMIFDPDFNQMTNFELFGINTPDSKTASTALLPTKTQVELTHQLLEMFVEQTRGLKLDILKILRNPVASLRTDSEGEAVFASNDTVL